MLSNEEGKKKTTQKHEFGIIKLERELISLQDCSDGESQTTQASHLKFMPSAELLSRIMGL